MNEFDKEVAARVQANGADAALRAAGHAFMRQSIDAKYSYNFSWLGRPIIQYPQDVLAMQEIIWQLQPDLIVETGIAHGGSLIFSASMLELNAACGGPNDAEVVAVDIDIRAHNRAAIDAHPLSRRITMIQGSSVAPDVVQQVRAKAAGKRTVLVCLDSNHTHEHVLDELRAYAPMATPGSYCVVFDTIVEDVPKDAYPDRPWGPGNSPKSAAIAYLRELAAVPRTGLDGTPLRYEVDKAVDGKLLISVAPDGYLKRLA